MLKEKVAQVFPKVAQKVAVVAFTKNDIFQFSPKSLRKFGLLLKENLSPRPFKIAQFGRTVQ